MPGASRAAASWPGSMEMRTGTRWATLVKLPVALSGRMTLNSDPVAGEMRSTRPFNVWPPRASTAISTGWPTRMSRICVSFILAVTQTASGTRAISCVPTETCWPTRTLTSPRRPARGAVMRVLSRSIWARRTWAWAFSTAASSEPRPTTAEVTPVWATPSAARAAAS